MRLRLHTFGMICALLLAQAAHGAEWIVGIYDYYFTPTNLTVAPGDKVTWVNMVNTSHDTTQFDVNDPNSGSLWFTEPFPRGQSFSFTFNGPGRYPYLCGVHYFDHPEQTGLVVVAQANLPPSVSITNPINGATLTAPASFTINAAASDSDGSVVSVEFFVNGISAGSSQGPSFSASATGLTAGGYALTAVATDNQGATNTSDVVNINVQAAPMKFPLAVNVQPPTGGSVVISPPQPVDGYDAGTIVTLTASATNGFAFSGWGGAITTTENPATLTMDAAKTVTANFSVNQNTTHTLTLLTNPANGGSIQVSPAPNGAGGTYVHGTPVTLTAVPAIGFLFTNFTGGVSATTNSVMITIDADLSVTANFVANAAPIFTLTLVTNPPGAGTIQSEPLPNAPGGGYYEGTLVTLTATALGTNAFTNWIGAASSTSNRVTVLMDGNKTESANFVPIIPPAYTLSVVVKPPGAGTVTVAPSANTNGTYSAGTTVALAAQPKPGFYFTNWTGATSTTNNPILIVMNGDRTVTANFVAIPQLEFAEVAGAFAGLLWDDHETNHTTSGFLSLRVTRTGAYRGTTTIGGIRESIKGQFDRFGYAPLVMRRGALSGSLQIDNAGARITGLLTDREKSPALLLYRTTAGSNAPALAGDYALIISSAPPVTSPGVFKLHLAANGTARFRGVLGDGTPFATRSFLSADGRVPLFDPLYHHRGGILGWLNISTNGTAQGTVRWIRPGDSRSQSFPEGFQLEVPIMGLVENNYRSRTAGFFLPQRDVICGPNLLAKSLFIRSDSSGSRSF